MSTALAKRNPLDLSFSWAVLTETGLLQTRKPTFEEWAATMAMLSHIGKCVQFAIGDAIIIGDREFGEQASQHYDKDTVNTFARVAERFPPTRRRVGLSFAHHETVAALAPDEQDHYLKRAEEEGWSRAELRKELGNKAHVAYNSGNNEWYTPEQYIRAAVDVMGRIDLDPASSAAANKTVKAKKIFTAEDDGLKQDWRGRVWMNPPYAQPLIQHFSEKLVESYQAGEVTEACVLVNNATETEWFQTLFSAASAVCFPKGRVKFWDAEGGSAGTPLQGQAFLYFGPNVDRFATVFGDFGAVVYASPVLEAAHVA